MVEFETVSIDQLSHERLLFISKISGIPQAKILRDFIEAVFSISVSYRKMSMVIYEEILSDRILIVCHGLRSPSHPIVGRCTTEQELTDVTFKKIEEDSKKKALGVV